MSERELALLMIKGMEAKETDPEKKKLIGFAVLAMEIINDINDITNAALDSRTEADVDRACDLMQRISDAIKEFKN